MPELQFPSEHITADNLVVGMPYIGDDNMTPDLAGMQFTVETISYDVDAETGNDLVILDVTVGSELWTEVCTPADSTAQLLAPND